MLKQSIHPRLQMNFAIENYSKKKKKTLQLKINYFNKKQII